MEEVNDVQALEKISSEVDESQIKVILSNQCIKAQAFLLDKLRKQAERHKETCGFISNANLKLEAEIKHSEQEISGMLIAQESIKSANIEIKKEWLLAKVRKADVIERIEEGQKRYEALWLECKTRYESIPFVQKLLRATEKVQALNIEIDVLDKQLTTLYEDMKTTREICINLDRKRSIELANFIVNEMPNTVKTIKEKSEGIDNITKEIEEMFQENAMIEDTVPQALESEQINTYENKDDYAVKNDVVNKSDEDQLIPKLELANFDLDFIDVNMEQVMIKKNELLNATPMATDFVNDIQKNDIKEHREEAEAYDYHISPYFNSNNENERQNFSKRKLINILEDIHINKKEAYDIVKKVNPEKFRAVNEISSEVVEDVQATLTFDKDEGNVPIEIKTIEEVNMSSSYAESIIIPPTQFLDMSLADDTAKKRVSFNIPSSLQINEIIEDVAKENDNDGNETANQTTNSQLDVSAASEDSFMKIKDMILKKHNLDLSPQFIYAKNPVLQTTGDDKIVTSKFFTNGIQESKTDELISNEMELDGESNVLEPEEKKEHENLEEQKSSKDDVMPMDVDAMTVSSPKENKVVEVRRYEKSVGGLLFTHGTQAIPDSLNASLSTTGFDDSDFPHCIDSSLLLSPKLDIPKTGEDPDVKSQEVPNFLSGFRKAGLSFFGGGASTSEPKPDSNVQNDGNNFSFNFGGEKKPRGGLFSLFQ